jgi:uncharacterized protein (DUF2252 family)
MSAIRYRKGRLTMAHRPSATETIENRVMNGHQAEYRSVSGRVELFTPEQRRAKGRTQRVAVPRMAHETFQESAYRPDPVDTLIQQGEDRLTHLLPIRYGRMLASPFAFFRGAAAVMAWDLSHTPSTNLTAQLCGDAHISNFGFFGSPERVLMFDINDFDETLPGPFEWDVKRLAASTVLAGRSIGLSDPTCQDVAQACIGQYRNKLTQFSEMTTLEVWYSHVTAESLLDFIPGAKRRKKVLAKIQKARAKDSQYAAAKHTDIAHGELRIVERPPLVVRLPEDEVDSVVHPVFEKYMQSLSDDRRALLDRYRYVDAGIRVGGVGSVGMRCYIVVLSGKDTSDPLVLQLKEAVGSVLAEYVRSKPFRNEGERIVQGQRLMQAVSDPFLGWVRHTTGRDMYVRQLFNMKASADLASMKASLFASYAGVCGEILARAHARSGDALQIAAYLGKNEQFEQAVARFAMSYADQTEADHKNLVDAVKSGKIEAETGI